MKTIATLIFVLFIGVTVQAQDTTEKVAKDTIEMTVNVENSKKEVSLKSNSEVARLYKRSNTRVKKALTFSTKASRPKTA